MEIIKEKLYEELCCAGMSPVRSREMVKQISQDIVDYPEIYSNKEKMIWAAKRNILPGRI